MDEIKFSVILTSVFLLISSSLIYCYHFYGIPDSLKDNFNLILNKINGNQEEEEEDVFQNEDNKSKENITKKENNKPEENNKEIKDIPWIATWKGIVLSFILEIVVALTFFAACVILFSLVDYISSKFPKEVLTTTDNNKNGGESEDKKNANTGMTESNEQYKQAEIEVVPESDRPFNAKSDMRNLEEEKSFLELLGENFFEMIMKIPLRITSIIAASLFNIIIFPFIFIFKKHGTNGIKKCYKHFLTIWFHNYKLIFELIITVIFIVLALKIFRPEYIADSKTNKNSRGLGRYTVKFVQDSHERYREMKNKDGEAIEANDAVGSETNNEHFENC